MRIKTIAVCTAAGFLAMAATIDLSNLYSYQNQPTPSYIVKDNTPGNNAISNPGATLGRVLFYDKQLSLNGTISCGSCHKQEFAFSDTVLLNSGFNGGLTGRHPMRLVNARFGTEAKFFWDERATSLEDQTTHPIQDGVEMGFSGTNGQPDIDSLIRRMYTISYYKTLFPFVFGDTVITEARIQLALSQFVRSIQSFDSKFDVGLSQANNNLQANFANFTAAENLGKTLFLNPPPQGGAGCQGCHRAPEFDIDPNTRNNGVIGVAGSPGTFDLTNTRAPSLRDLVNPQGQLNGPLMHNGVFTSIDAVINHYNAVPNNPNNTNLDNRLAGPGGNLQLTQNEKNALKAFLLTLTGSDVYTNPKWSDPFDSQGNITLIGLSTGVSELSQKFKVYPNPATSYISVFTNQSFQYHIFSISGTCVSTGHASPQTPISVTNLAAGVYILRVQEGLHTQAVRFIKMDER